MTNWNAMVGAARHQLAGVRVKIDASAGTSQLALARGQPVEWVKVLTPERRVHGDPVILLDKPTSALARGGGIALWPDPDRRDRADHRPLQAENREMAADSGRKA